MTYRSLLVALDQDPLCEARIQAAARLALAHDCHLVGVAPTGLLELPATPGAAATLSEFAAVAWDTLRGQAEQAAERFREACRAAGLRSFESVVDESEQAASLVRHAHCSDLTVLTQAQPTGPAHRAAQQLVEDVVLHSARPTLVLPYAGATATLGTSAMVAWDDSREAARAVADALPLLQRAQRVQVVSWNESGRKFDSTLPPRLEALERWLMWHGVPCEVRVETTEIEIADAMLSRASDLGVDLLVMGAYGHPRLMERVLGGATRGLLASMTVPVLMSH
jgi:nucleotide-binding universal stress UspA family protein